MESVRKGQHEGKALTLRTALGGMKEMATVTLRTCTDASDARQTSHARS